MVDLAGLNEASVPPENECSPCAIAEEKDQ